MDISECPVCKTKNEIEILEIGKCINCGNRYWFVEDCSEDILYLYWEKYSK